jgi:hypothetical protein
MNAILLAGVLLLIVMVGTLFLCERIRRQEMGKLALAHGRRALPRPATLRQLRHLVSCRHCGGHTGPGQPLAHNPDVTRSVVEQGIVVALGGRRSLSIAAAKALPSRYWRFEVAARALQFARPGFDPDHHRSRRRVVLRITTAGFAEYLAGHEVDLHAHPAEWDSLEPLLSAFASRVRDAGLAPAIVEIEAEESYSPEPVIVDILEIRGHSLLEASGADRSLLRQQIAALDQSLALPLTSPDPVPGGWAIHLGGPGPALPLAGRF